ncbi:MAG: hypothetical protein WC451_02650 [Patescibacteria group bacterium]
MEKNIEIIKLATWENRIDYNATIALAENNTLLSIVELNQVVADKSLREKYKDCLPARSGTRIKYKAHAQEAIIKHPDQEEKTIYFPLEDGWYEVGEDGIPNGKPSSESNPKALYLSRWQDRDYVGLVARGYGGFLVTRVVDCGYCAVCRFGVLGVRQKKGRVFMICSKCWESEPQCVDCGESIFSSYSQKERQNFTPGGHLEIDGGICIDNKHICPKCLELGGYVRRKVEQ